MLNVRGLLHVVFTLLYSLLNRGGHVLLIVSIIAPTVLSVLVSSIPGFSGLIEPVSLIREDRILVIEKSRVDNCTLVYLSPGVLGNGSEVPVLFVSEYSAIENMLKARSTQCNMSLYAVSLPTSMYMALGKPCSVVVKIGDHVINASVTQVHEDPEAVIIYSRPLGNSIKYTELYLCSRSSTSLLESMFQIATRDFQSFASMWLILLGFTSAIGAYIASTISTRSLKREITSIRNIGISKRQLLLVLEIVYALVLILAMVFLIVVSLASLYSISLVINVFMPTFTPNPSLHSMIAYLTPLYLTILGSTGLGAWRVLSNECY